MESFTYLSTVNIQSVAACRSSAPSSHSEYFNISLMFPAQSLPLYGFSRIYLHTGQGPLATNGRYSMKVISIKVKVMSIKGQKKADAPAPT